MDLIQNSPFRILGVFVNSPARHIVANVNRAKAYLNVGRVPEFPCDFNAFLPAVSRTLENIEHVQAVINQTNDRIKYSLFWFARDSSSDEIALGYLNSGNIAKAKEIFESHPSYSSLLNRGVVAVFEHDLKTALSVYGVLIHEYSFRTEFLNAVCGTSVKIAEEELSHIFLDTLLDSFAASDVLNAFDSSSNQDDKSYVHEHAVSGLISLINSEIATAKNADKEASVQLAAGRELMDNTRQSILQLKQLIGFSGQYQIIADNLAKQILQSGVNYYNESNEIDKASKAYILQHYAENIAVGTLTKKRCKENVDILKEEIEALPPENLMEEAKTLISKLALFRLDSGNIDKAISFIEDCGPYLASVREVQGVNGKFYRHISTEVEEAALVVTIAEVNTALKAVENAEDSKRYTAIISLTSILIKAWEVTQIMNQLDIEAKAKTRFDSQRQSLSDLMSKAGVGALKISTSFKLETETEIYNACRTKSEYQSYLRRFPNGKYKDEVQNKVNEIECREQEEKRLLQSSINKATTFTEAIALYSKCKDQDILKILDDRCFGLCKTKRNYKKYVGTFGSSANHASEAKSHLKFDCVMSNIWKEHKGWIITISILVAVFLGVGLIWGSAGYAKILWVIGILCAIVAWVGISSINGKGCGLGIICGTIAAACIYGANGIDDYVDYESLKSGPTLDGCSSFLSKHPGSNHREEVLEMYYYCAQASGIEALNKLAEGYSNFEWGRKASARVSQMCDSLYQIADKAHTVQAWKNYQAAVPYNHYSDSDGKIEKIENEAWSTESKAWRQAAKENTLIAYQKYLKLYPDGSHKYAADRKVIDLQVAKVYAGEHGDLPAMDQTGYGSGPSSNIAIENSTSYTLTLLYSGPDSKRVVVLPNGTSRVTLKNGTYHVAASVSASNVGNFAGTETLKGGSYSVQYYIVTSRY